MAAQTRIDQLRTYSSCIVQRADISFNKYIRLPPACTPYILRVSLEAGTPASKNGIFKTNFPLDGGLFTRDRFAER